MRRSMKKGVAFFMALSLVAGLYQPVEAKASEKSGGKMIMLAEEKYDEAAVLSEKVVLLENGNWSGSDSQYEYVEEEQYSDITTDTNIVFMDAKGETITINNKDSNGEMLFDAVYPMISEGWYAFDMVKVIKDHKISYIKDDGTYYGDSLQYYTDAIPLTNDLLLISEDGTNYSVINSMGETVQNNLTNFSAYNIMGEYIYLYYEANCLIIDETGRTVKLFENFGSLLYLAMGYTAASDGTTTQLYDPDFNMIYEYDVEYDVVDTYCAESGCIVLMDFVQTETEYSVKSKVINIETGNCILEADDSVLIADDVIIYFNTEKGSQSVMSLDGTEYISNVDEFVLSMPGVEYTTVWTTSNYVDGNLYISAYGGEDGEIEETYVLDKASGFNKESAKRFEGTFDGTSYDGKYFITSSIDGFVRNLVTTDGTLVKDFGEQNTYGWPWGCDSYYIKGAEYDDRSIDGFSFFVDVMEGEEYLGCTYITETGEVGKTYDLVEASGNFVMGYYDDYNTIDIINSSNEIVYTTAEAEVGGFWWKDWFYVCEWDEDGRTYVYDAEGNVIFGDEKVYGGLGYDGVLRNAYYAHEGDRLSAYCYMNTILESGLGVTMLWDEEDGCKYGVALFKSQEELYTGLKQVDGEWLMYEDGVVTGNYNGLVKYDEQWWYVKNSKLDFSYTGLCQHNGSWFYVSGGKVNFNYTGLCQYDGNWWQVNGGVVNFKYTGLTKHAGSWWYVSGGKVNFNYTGLCQYNGSWFYVEKGKVNFKYSGLAKHAGSWWQVNGGIVDFKYTGLTQYNGDWYYTKGGKVDFSYTGLCKYGGSWYYIQNGKLNWNYTGLCKYGGSWYYVQKGVLNWNYTGLCKYGGSWYYVQKGVLNWNYTGLCKYGGSWYYVQKGVLNWNYTGLCQYGGSWYYVQKGVLNWNYTGLCKYGSTWYYVQKGVLNWNYTGYTNYGGSRWYVEKGVMVRQA